MWKEFSRCESAADDNIFSLRAWEWEAAACAVPLVTASPYRFLVCRPVPPPLRRLRRLRRTR